VQGGVEKHCENLYPRIAGKMTVVVYRRRPYVTHSKDACYPGIQFVDLPSTRIKGFESLWHSLLSTLHILTQPRGTVHIHNIGPALFTPILRLFGYKVVLTYHTANYEHQKWNIAVQVWLKISEKVALKYANSILFINHFRMEQSVGRFRKKSHCIPNGITPPVFSYSSEYLEKWGIKNEKYILSVGRISPEKGFDILLKAFSSIHTDFKLVIAGGAETEKNYYERLIDLSDRNRVIFTGYVYGEPLYQLYTHAELFVLPSRSEGFPLVLLEAMSYHLPLIVSDIPATRLVELPPQNYFPVEDVDALKNKLIDFIQQKHCPKPSYDLSPYDWDQIAEQTLEIYEKIGKRPRHGH
jgi:glycosyltransferase involved in cell wall biosynthesis